MDQNNIKPVPSPVSDALIMICEKCGKKLAATEDPEQNPSRQLQKQMKETVKERFGKGKIRPVVSSCFDVCPKDEVTVAIVRFDNGAKKSQFYCIPKDDFMNSGEALIDLATK